MYLIRLLIVGETGVGKTSLLVRFHENNFIFAQKATIGVDYKAKEIQIDSETVKLQIWDTAGQERFRSMTSAFYSRAQGIAITFDVGLRYSFEALPSWIKEINEIAPRGCVLVLCANKIDLSPELWQTKREEYVAFSEEVGIPVIECSASSGLNVQEIFVELGRQVLHSHRSELTQVRDDLDGPSGKSVILADFAERERRRRRERSSCCSKS
eukprot:gene7589-8389_t